VCENPLKISSVCINGSKFQEYLVKLPINKGERCGGGLMGFLFQI
jgi:hypothetical protein